VVRFNPEKLLAEPAKSSMRAAVYRGPGKLDVTEWPVPVLGAHDVLLQVSHCGVCGTDLHFVIDGWGRPGSIGGHEYSGSVAAVGSEVSNWKVGDLAVGGPDAACGTCEYCRAQRPGLCLERSSPGVSEYQGAFAEYKLVPADQLLPIPKGLGLREAALTEPLAVALHSITLSSIAAGQRALVTGAGPIGALILAALRAKGVEEVVVSEPSPMRRELATALGATEVIAPEGLETPTSPFAIAEDSVDVAFECSGRGSAFEGALAKLKRAGTLVLVGTGLDQPPLNLNRILLNELVVTGAFNYDENGFEDALDLLASGSLPTERLIESTDVGLEELLGACQRLAAGEVGGKQLVVPI